MPAPPERQEVISNGQAVALGLLHGPTELLPVSSSGHTTLVPWLLGSSYPDHDPALRKSFEIALHAGTAAGLLWALRREVGEASRGLDTRRRALIAGSFLPPAIVGYTLEGPIENRLGTPGTIALGLIAGSVVMAAADLLGPQVREREEAGALDGLLLGLAQATALIPGTSRGGMTLAAMRARGFKRPAASALSRHVALPVIAGAAALKGMRLAQRGLPPGSARPLAIGALASAASTVAAARLVPVERVGSLLPYAAYRSALGAIALRRLGGSGR
jgi:undecaprenyl-diphosphatase